MVGIQGYRSIAVVLLHAYTFTDHERMVGRIARDVGFKQVHRTGKHQGVLQRQLRMC